MACETIEEDDENCGAEAHKNRNEHGRDGVTCQEPELRVQASLHGKKGPSQESKEHVNQNHSHSSVYLSVSGEGDMDLKGSTGV
jgi:hypothetical protein